MILHQTGHGYGKVWQGMARCSVGSRANLVERDVQTSNCRGNTAAPNASAAQDACSLGADSLTFAVEGNALKSWKPDRITSGKLEETGIFQHGSRYARDQIRTVPLIVSLSFFGILFPGIQMETRQPRHCELGFKTSSSCFLKWGWFLKWGLARSTWERPKTYNKYGKVWILIWYNDICFRT